MATEYLALQLSKKRITTAGKFRIQSPEYSPNLSRSNHSLKPWEYRRIYDVSVWSPSITEFATLSFGEARPVRCIDQIRHKLFRFQVTRARLTEMESIPLSFFKVFSWPKRQLLGQPFRICLNFWKRWCQPDFLELRARWISSRRLLSLVRTTSLAPPKSGIMTTLLPRGMTIPDPPVEPYRKTSPRELMIVLD